MKLEVVLAPGVELELQEILDYQEKMGGVSSAKRFLESFSRKIELIGQFPFLYPLSERFPEGRKCVIQKRAVLYFRIKGGGLVEIISIRDGRSSRV